jgi:hypothetical protein
MQKRAGRARRHGMKKLVSLADMALGVAHEQQTVLTAVDLHACQRIPWIF